MGRFYVLFSRQRTVPCLIFLGGAFSPRIDKEAMNEILVEDYELLVTVAGFLASLDHDSVSIDHETEAVMVVQEQSRDIPFCDGDGEFADAIAMLKSIGYWSIGKNNNGVYFQRRVGQEGIVGLIYSLDGEIPIHARLHIRRIEPLSQDGWFHFETWLTPEQCIEEAEAALRKNFELFDFVKNYLAHVEYRRIIIVGLMSDMSVSNSGRVSISDADVVNAIVALRARGFRAIFRSESAVVFQRSTRGRHFSNGLAYSIAGNEPELLFLTTLVPLDVNGWFYYEEDFREFRNLQ